MRYSIITLFIVIMSMFQVQAQGFARLQIIHNASDPAASSVDIYLNETLLLDNFEFRTATPFIDAPAGVELNIGIAPSNSASVNDTIVNIPIMLEENETYIAIANGVLDSATFSENPERREIGFALYPKTGIRESSVSANNVDFVVFHGATDAPAVDVLARGVAPLVDDAGYGEFTDYISVPPSSYTLDITADSDNDLVVASYQADLSELAGGSAVVFASGFLNPEANQSGQPFGIFAALPTGDVVEFPALTTARLQVIHNSADPAAHTVDIYVNGGLLIDDFRFRKATPFIDVPAGVDLTIGVAPAHSMSAEDVIATLPPVKLLGGEKYLAFASGVLNDSSFAANPDTRDITFQLYIKGMAREMGTSEMNTDVFVFHGATDAPQVDVVERTAGSIVDNAGYGDMTGYLSLKSAHYYYLDVQTADNAATVASYKVAFFKQEGKGAVIFASGFLTPEANQNGAGFGLFVAYPDGRVDELPVLDTARLQVIHNSADPAAEIVDIYVNNEILIPNFEFRDATPFIEVPANINLEIGVAPPGSNGSEDIFLTLPPVSLMGDKKYVAVASGIVGDGFAANPDGLDTSFKLIVNDMGQEKAAWRKYVEFSVLHGSTDAPGIDVLVNGNLKLVNNLSYGQFTNYLRVVPASYILEITPASMPETVVASYVADLTGLRGGSAVVFASGFLSPENNNEGPIFGLFAALPTGDVVQFTQTESLLKRLTNVEQQVSVVKEYNLEQNYPNPFNPSTTISFALPEKSDVKVVVYDMLGKEIVTLVNEEKSAGRYNLLWNGIDSNGLGVASGTYLYRIEAGNFNMTRKMTLVK